MSVAVSGHRLSRMTVLRLSLWSIHHLEPVPQWLWCLAETEIHALLDGDRAVEVEEQDNIGSGREVGALFVLNVTDKASGDEIQLHHSGPASIVVTPIEKERSVWQASGVFEYG